MENTTSGAVAEGVVKAVLVLALLAGCVGFMLSQCEATVKAGREAERAAYGGVR